MTSEKECIFRMKPFREKTDITLSVPGSKSITNRALLLAALSEGKSTLKGVLFSDDSRVFMEALQTLGYEVKTDEEKQEAEITGCGCRIPGDNIPVYVGSAGTAARFLTAMLALSGGRYEMTASEQMSQRPMEPLLRALEQLGTVFEYLGRPYSFPFRICGKKEKVRDVIPLNIDASSQFLSALLLCGVFESRGFRILLTGHRDAKSYVRISMKMMRDFGCEMRQCSENEYEILPAQSYRAREYRIEPDVSAACYFYAMAAVNGGTALVRNVTYDSVQGDIAFLGILEKMGCRLRELKEGIELRGTSRLRGLSVNMSDCSDQTMTMAAVSVFADSPTYIAGVGHIRGQESDRIHGIVTELRRLGIKCEEREDGIVIHPGVPVADESHPVRIQTYEDHRMAMAFAVIGTKVPGIIIDNPLCCRKTFENYFEVLTNLDLRLE